jgi:endoglucanase
MYRQTKLPRWRGFNLDGRHKTDGHFQEKDFQLISELGFDFVRLPLSYWDWIDNKDPFAINESKLEFIDEAVNWGIKYGIHTSINFHRGPGFCVGGIELEPFRLFEDKVAQTCFYEHWQVFAKRYQGIPSRNISFNLLNEPRWVAPREHGEVMRTAVRRLHAIDPDRLILLDGLNTGNDFPTDLVDLGLKNVAFSTRGYVPLGVSHYEATWGHHQLFEKEMPSWPMGRNRVSSTDYYDGLWDRARLAGKYRAWAAIAEASQCGVMCGECGCFNKTPHAVALGWMNDLLSILTEFNFGYALWNFRGPFGILDSERSDVAYEDYKGHQLDRKMLEILKKY